MWQCLLPKVQYYYHFLLWLTDIGFLSSKCNQSALRATGRAPQVSHAPQSPLRPPGNAWNAWSCFALITALISACPRDATALMIRHRSLMLSIIEKQLGLLAARQHPEGVTEVLMLCVYLYMWAGIWCIHISFCCYFAGTSQSDLLNDTWMFDVSARDS